MLFVDRSAASYKSGPGPCANAGTQPGDGWWEDRGAATWSKDAWLGNAPGDLKYQEEKLLPEKWKTKEAQRAGKGSSTVRQDIITMGMEDKFSIIPGDFNDN